MDYIVYASIDGHHLHHTVQSLATARSFAKKIFYCLPLMGVSIANGFKVAVIPANQFRRNNRGETKVTTWFQCEIVPSIIPQAKLYSCSGKGENVKPLELTLNGCGFTNEREARFVYGWVCSNLI